VRSSVGTPTRWSRRYRVGLAHPTASADRAHRLDIKNPLAPAAKRETEEEACFIVKGKDGEAVRHNAENPEAFSHSGFLSSRARLGSGPRAADIGGWGPQQSAPDGGGRGCGAERLA